MLNKREVDIYLALERVILKVVSFMSEPENVFSSFLLGGITNRMSFSSIFIDNPPHYASSVLIRFDKTDDFYFCVFLIHE